MENRKEKALKLGLAIANIGLLIKLIKDCFNIVEFKHEFIILLVFSGIGLYFLFNKILNKKWKKTLFIVSIMVVTSFLLLRNSSELLLKLIGIGEKNYDVINDAIYKGKEIPFGEFKLSFSIGIPLITSILMALNSRFVSFSTLVTFIVFIVFWYLIFYEKVIENIPLLLGLVIFTLGIRQYNGIKKYYSGREIKSSIKVTGTFIILVLISIILPIGVGILPQDYKGQQVDKVLTFFTNGFTGDEGEPVEKAKINSFSMKISGYSDSSQQLGGSIILNDIKVFNVVADRPYYLRGKVKDYYDGFTWNNTSNDIEEKDELPLEYQGGIQYLKNVENSQNKSITIIPDHVLRTTSYFTPNGAIDVKNDNEKLYIDKIPLFLTTKFIKNPYEIEMVSYGQEDNFLQDIRNVKDKNISVDEDYTLPMRDYGTKDLDYYNLLEEKVDFKNPKELKKYNKFKWQYMDCLQVSDTVDERVFDLVHNIMKDKAKEKKTNIVNLTNDDKTLAIMEYLKTNYRYRTHVNDVDYDDFVSNFLLKSPKGYCTYFASATTVMCRIAGVPARYVEGFNMNNEQAEDNVYTITNEDAHAWAEVLVNPSKGQWAVVDSVPSAEDEANNPDPIILDGGKEENIEEVTVNNEKPDVLNKSVEEVKVQKPDMGNGIGKKVIIYIVLIVSLIVIWLFIYYEKLKKVKRCKSIIPLYKYYQKRLGIIGYSKPKNLGDKEFAENIMDENLRERVLQLVNLTYKEFYGGIIDNSIDREEYIQYLEQYIKNKQKLYRYIIKRYIPIYRRTKR